MSKTTKIFFSLLLFFLMGGLWGWWPLQHFVGGALCFAILTTWLIESVLGDEEPPKRRK